MRRKDLGWNKLKQTREWKNVLEQQMRTDALCDRYNPSLASSALQQAIGAFLIDVRSISGTLDNILYDATHNRSPLSLPERIDELAYRLEKHVKAPLEEYAIGPAKETLRDDIERNYIEDCWGDTIRRIDGLHKLAVMARENKFQHLLTRRDLTTTSERC